jgi:DNA-binding protein Alba
MTEPTSETGVQETQSAPAQPTIPSETTAQKPESNVVFIGKKPSMAYVLAAVTQFGDGQDCVHIKARGRSISKAVDIAEIVRNKFILNAKVENIEIGTEKLTGNDGRELNVSTMDIVLRK